MKISTEIRLQYLAPAALAFLAGFGSAVQAADARGAMAEDTYTWTGYVVAYDESAQAVTLKARVEAHAVLEDLESFEEGDRLTLIWTGRQWAAGIRDIRRDPEHEPGTLTLPIEFVASEDDGRYVHFRVPVPDDAAALIRDFEPGTAVTGTSPKTASDWASGVISLRHYNDVS